MPKFLYLLYIFGPLMLVKPTESGFYDYDNEVYDYFRQDSSNQDNVKSTVSYECKSEGFHEDPNNCKVFYRCVEWENGTPLTPFRFECGPGTVFSSSKGNICVHPNDSGRSECCEPSNEIDSSNPSDSWSHKPRPTSPTQNQESSIPSLTGPENPLYPNQLPQTHRPQYPSQPSYTQEPQYTPQTPQNHLPQQQNSLATPDQSGTNECSGFESVSCGPSAGCTQEGFFSNPEDCHKFYRCVNESSLKRYDFSCGTGTAWDQNAQTCNHENSVANCGSSSESEGPILGSQDQISNSVTPSEGLPYPSTKPTHHPTNYPIQKPSPNQYPNKPTYLPPHSTQSSSKPVYTPSQSTSGTIQMPYPSQIPTKSPLSQNTNGPEYLPPQSTTNISHSDNGNNPSEPSGTGGKPCPPTGPLNNCKEEGFFPNTQDCHKFYRCVIENGSFHEYHFECGTITAWDQQLQTCNYENAIPNCKNSESTHLPDYSSPSMNHTPNSEHISRPPNNQSSQSTKQPNTDTSQSLTPTSEAALHSSEKPDVISSELPQSSSQVTQSISVPHLTTPSGGSHSSSITNNIHLQKPSTCQSEGFFANPEDCRKFYRCVSNPPGYIKYDFDCGPGTAWDQSLLTCNYIAQVATCNKVNNEIEPHESVPNVPPSTSQVTSLSSSTSLSVQTTPNQFQPSDSSTTSSENSINTQDLSTPVSIESSASTSPINSTESSFESSKNPNCNTPKPHDIIVCNKAGFYPHPTRCDKFYRCVDNGKGFNIYHFDCPVGTIFDPSIDVCNYPNSVYPSRNCQTGEEQGTQMPTPGINVSTSDRIPPTSTKPLSTTEMDTTSSESTMSSFETTVSESESTLPSSDSTTPTSDLSTPSPESTLPSSESTTLSSESTTLSSESTTLSSESTTLSSESTTLSSESTTLNSESATLSSESTTLTSESTPDSESTTPDLESTTSSSESMTSTLESTTSSSESTTSNSESTTSSSEGTTSESESNTSESEITTSNSEATTEEQSITTSSSTSVETATTETSELLTDNTSPSEQQSTTSASQEITISEMSSTDSQESTTTSNAKPSTAENCPTLANLTDEQIVLICPTGFKRHPKLCNLFYQCTMSSNMEIKILILQCPEGTIFDEKTNKCLSNSESTEPCKGTTAGKRIQRGVNNALAPPIEVSTNPLCPDEGHFPYQKGCSNIFYKCRRDAQYELQGFVYKCPKNFVYWSVSRRCERASRLPMCTSMSNETENRNEAWENRWEIPVEDRNLSARTLFLS